MFLSVFPLQSTGCGGDRAIEGVGVWAAIWHMSSKGLSQITGRHPHGSSDTLNHNISHCT